MRSISSFRNIFYSAYMRPPPIPPKKTPYEVIQAQGFNVGFYGIWKLFHIALT